MEVERARPDMVRPITRIPKLGKTSMVCGEGWVEIHHPCRSPEAHVFSLRHPKSLDGSEDVGPRSSMWRTPAGSCAPKPVGRARCREVPQGDGEHPHQWCDAGVFSLHVSLFPSFPPEVFCYVLFGFWRDLVKEGLHRVDCFSLIHVQRSSDFA